MRHHMFELCWTLARICGRVSDDISVRQWSAILEYAKENDDDSRQDFFIFYRVVLEEMVASYTSHPTDISSETDIRVE